MKLIKKSIILLGLVLTLVVIKNFGTYAWYTVNNNDVAEGNMGIVDTNAEEKGGARLLRASATKDTNIVKNFTIENNSTIDTFVRLSYTISFFNDKGEEVLVDSSKVKLASATVLVGDNSVGYIDEEVNSNSYSKKFIIPSDGSGSDKCYLKISPGQNINGTFNFEAVEVEGLTAEVAISSETIQATLKAVQNASEYGWDDEYFRQNF